MEKEEYAIVLDFLPNGYPFDKKPMYKKTAIAQAIGATNMTLLELVPKKDVNLQPSQRVYIGEGKRDQIHHIIGKIPYERLTNTAMSEVEFIIKDIVKENESKFVEFFNKAGPLSTRMHQLELIPGLGKKHMWEILDQRKEEPFKNFEDIKKRVKLLPNPEKAIIKRILNEIKGKEKYKIFTK